MIELINLRKEFDDLVAVNDLNLTIPQGEIYGLIGPNGAGKTTTIRMACGLLAPTQGNVRVADIDVLSEPERAPQHIGYLSDFFSVYEDLKVTRLKSPLLKGVLYVCLYCAAAAVLSTVFSVQSEAAAERVAALLTPAGVFDPRANGFHFPATVFLGMALQLGVVGILLAAIARRLGRPARIPAMAAD